MTPFRSVGLSVISWGLLLLTATDGRSQVVFPAKPDKYDVQARYRIRAARDIRIVQFEQMAAHLKAIGFVHTDQKAFEQSILDPGAESIVGTLPAAAVAKLFADDNIKTAVLVPAGGTQLDDPKKLVPVRIELNSGLAASEQKMLHDQVAEHLGLLGFVPALGYDHAGYTRLRGAIPAGQVRSLVKDLRSLPGGWIVGGDRASLPLPLSAVLPVRTVEVLPDLPAGAPAAPLAAPGKYAPDVQAIAADMTAAEKPLVVEALLEQETTAITAVLLPRLRAALPGAMVEGFVGNVVTLRLPRAALVANVAALQDVRHIRLPRTASETIGPATGWLAGDFVSASRVNQLHALGYDGEGVQVVVVASEFAGVASKSADGGKTVQWSIGGITLPPGSRLFDLTGEVNPTLMPRAAGATASAGAATALAVRATAPKAAIILLRVDPSRFHQLLTVAKAASGDPSVSPALATRSEELSVRGSILQSRRRGASDELQRAFTDLTDDPKAKKRRDDAAAAMKQLQADEADYKGQLDRFLALKTGLELLRGSGVVVNTLVWEAGYPHDTQSEVSRYLETVYSSGASVSAIRASKKPPVPVWVQAAGGSVGSVWSGPYLDADRNGLMEFAAAGQKIPAGRWTRELAFLGHKTADGKTAATLPAGLKVRLTIQWREPHLRDVILPEEPTHPIHLRLFQQLDPSGRTAASDELAEVARSAGTITRLYKSAGSGVYETVLDVTIPANGVYAVRVEGGSARTDLPPSSRLAAELRPRLFVEVLDPKQAGEGQVVLNDYAVQNAGVGVPADSPAAVTVGGASSASPPGATSLTGVGPGVALGKKPDLLAAGTIVVGGKDVSGSGVAAGYVAGVAASVLSAGVRPADMARAVGLQAGEVLALPPDWLQRLTPKAARSGVNR